MVSRILKRPRTVAGKRKLPRTRTSSVPGGVVGVSWSGFLRKGFVGGKGEHTIAGFVEAVRRVAVGGEDRDAVAELLEADGGVEDEALGAADAEVWVEEYDALALGHYGGCVWGRIGRTVGSFRVSLEGDGGLARGRLHGWGTSDIGRMRGIDVGGDAHCVSISEGVMRVCGKRVADEVKRVHTVLHPR